MPPFTFTRGLLCNKKTALYIVLTEPSGVIIPPQVKQIPTEEGRNAELALYRRRPDEAEAILIQVGGMAWGLGGSGRQPVLRAGFLPLLLSSLFRLVV